MGKTISMGAALLLAAIAAFIAYRKSQPAAPSPTSNTPANPQTSTSVAVPSYGTLYGLAGLTPVVSFPDVGGTSANITQPV
jgi:hypothetical protein